MTAISLPLAFLTAVAVVGANSAPRGGSITWLPDGKTLAVANFDAGSITLVGTRPLSKLVEIAVDGHPRSVAASRDGQRLFVSLAETDQLLWMDLQQRGVVHSVPIPGGPFTLVGHPHSDMLYVAAAYTHLISAVDTTTGKITRQLPVPRFPRG